MKNEKINETFAAAVYESQLQTHVRWHLKIIFILNQRIKGKQAKQIRYLRAKQESVGYRV